MKLKRDKETVLSRLVTKDNTVATKLPCYLQVPERWIEGSAELGTLQDPISVYAFFPIIFEDGVYSVMNVPAIISLNPSKINTTVIKDESYYQFWFDENTVIFPNINLIKTDTLTYNILDELILKGKAPWWATVSDLCSLFDLAQEHAASNIGKIPQSLEFLVGVCSRLKTDLTKYVRQNAKTLKDLDIDNVDYIPFTSVLYSVNNTVDKIAGGYFHQGVISAIINPSNEAGRTETLLRT